MTDQEHAVEIRGALYRLHGAVRAARAHGLKVDLILAGLVVLGEHQGWNPDNAVDVYRPLR
jgi:hypothetical protein